MKNIAMKKVNLFQNINDAKNFNGASKTTNFPEIGWNSIWPDIQKMEGRQR